MSKFVACVHWVDPSKNVKQYMQEAPPSLTAPHREFYIFDSRADAESFSSTIRQKIPVKNYNTTDEAGTPGPPTFEPIVNICPYSEVFS